MKKVVVIGGGTGTFTVLSGLKNYPIKLSAIVSMADDGGSTGRLRDELGVLPPGDIRQCLIALSDSSEKMRELMNYRFEEGSLKGHSFGNLFLSALEKTNGSFSKGVKQAMEMLNVKGEVIPVLEEDVTLYAELNDGSIISGEDEIDSSHLQGNGVKRIFYEKEVDANSEAIRKVLDADTIIIGPGDHYSGTMQHMIIKNFADAINKSKAKVVYVVNLTNKKNHTEVFDVDDYVDSIENYIGKDRINYVIHNTGEPSKELLERYILQEGQKPLVEINISKKQFRKYHLIQNNFVSLNNVKLNSVDEIAHRRSFIRHDSNLLATAIMQIVNMKLWVFDLDDTLYNKSLLVGEDYSKVPSIYPFPDTHDVLKKIKGIKILVTSARGNEEIKKIQDQKLDLLKLRDLFQNVIILGSSEEKNEIFGSLLSKYKVSKRKDIVIVGDRIDSEIRYGNILGCTTVLFRFKEGKYAGLKPKDIFEIPDFTISSLSELLELEFENGH